MRHLLRYGIIALVCLIPSLVFSEYTVEIDGLDYYEPAVTPVPTWTPAVTPTPIGYWGSFATDGNLAAPTPPGENYLWIRGFGGIETDTTSASFSGNSVTTLDITMPTPVPTAAPQTLDDVCEEGATTDVSPTFENNLTVEDDVDIDGYLDVLGTCTVGSDFTVDETLHEDNGVTGTTHYYRIRPTTSDDVMAFELYPSSDATSGRGSGIYPAYYDGSDFQFGSIACNADGFSINSPPSTDAAFQLSGQGDLSINKNSWDANWPSTVHKGFLIYAGGWDESAPQWRAYLSFESSNDDFEIETNYGDILINASDGGDDVKVTDYLHVANMKTGTTQANAGAAAGELWADSDDDYTVKLGQ